MALRELPDYPWDLMAPYAERARAHADGIVDLSIGSPVDPTPALIRDAFAAATDAHAYPQTIGTPALREAIVDWFARRRGVPNLTVDNVLPTIGSKELVAFLPFMLGLGEGDVVVHPRAAYPTYAIGAAIAGGFIEAGAKVLICDVDAEALARFAASHPNATATRTDVADPAAVERLFVEIEARLGGLDVLVNNAGIAGPTGPIDELAVDDIKRTLDVDLLGQFLVARLAVPLLRASSDAAIVNIS